jgi:hypothetical protein
MAEHSRRSFDIYIDREYHPCGCAYLVDVKSGEERAGFPCARHGRLTEPAESAEGR